MITPDELQAIPAVDLPVIERTDDSKETGNNPKLLFGLPALIEDSVLSSLSLHFPDLDKFQVSDSATHAKLRETTIDEIYAREIAAMRDEPFDPSSEFSHDPTDDEHFVSIFYAG